MKPTRVFGDPQNDDAAYYVEGTLNIEDVIYDRSPESPLLSALRVESVTFEEVLLSALVASYPQERAIYFLRNNAVTALMAGKPVEDQKSEQQYWHVITSEGVLRDFGGIVKPAAGHSVFIRELENSAFDSVVSELRLLADTPRDVN